MYGEVILYDKKKNLVSRMSFTNIVKPTSHVVAATLSCGVVVFMCAKKLTALGLGFLPTTLFELTN
jgi:hypothetical protein